MYFRYFKRKIWSLTSDCTLKDDCHFESQEKRNYETFASGVFLPEMRLVKVLSSTPGSS